MSINYWDSEWTEAHQQAAEAQAEQAGLLGPCLLCGGSGRVIVKRDEAGEDMTGWDGSSPPPEYEDLILQGATIEDCPDCRSHSAGGRLGR